jgi:catechol 2,3-dioxygenase
MDSPTIDPDTTIGAVHLAVNDLGRAAEFYERAIGLRSLGRDGQKHRLGVDGERPLIVLTGEPGAPPRPPGTTGLFHLAIVVPSRVELAYALRRLLEAGARLSGASDHLVSEALYLSDPEGNGIEIYRDRPREQWPRTNGSPRMATLPLDLEGLAGELDAQGAVGSAPARTRLGHVHLQVGDLGAAEAFYGDTIGFEVTVRGYPGALFLAAGDYHHHIGLNTWAGEGAPHPPPGARGLRAFEIAVPSRAELDRIIASLEAAGIQPAAEGNGRFVRDPSGNGVLLATA